MLLLNAVFIVTTRNSDTEVDSEDITPEDYTLMISNVPKDYRSEEDLKTKILDIHNTHPIEINMTYSIGEYVELKNKFKVAKKKLRMMYHNQKDQIGGGLCSEPQTKEEVAREILALDAKLNLWLDEFEDEDKKRELFTGVVFATFADVYEYEAFKNAFPQSLLSYIFHYLRYLVCGCCAKNREKYEWQRTLELIVTGAPEPDDIKWDNLQITRNQRYCRQFGINLVAFLILCMSFGVLLGISYGQRQIQINNQAGKYILSLIFSIVISSFNWVIKKVFVAITSFERNVSHTNHQLSLSFKLLFVSLIIK